LKQNFSIGINNNPEQQDVKSANKATLLGVYSPESTCAPGYAYASLVAG